MASKYLWQLAIAFVCLFSCAPDRVAAQSSGIQTVADVVKALQESGHYKSFLYAIKNTGVLVDLANILDATGRGATILAPTDSAFPDPIEARDAAKIQKVLSLRYCVGSHILLEYMPNDQLSTYKTDHSFSTMGRPVHLVETGTLAVSAAPPGKEGVDERIEFEDMRGAISTVVTKNVYDDGNVVVHGVEILLLPATS